MMRSADERRNASSITSNSIKCASVGGQVGCTMKTSPPRTFSSIWKLNSPSEKRSAKARPISQPRCFAISSANFGFALPQNTLMPPVVLIKCFEFRVLSFELGVFAKLETQNSKLRRIGWGGRIRTYECRFQRPVPYHLATPQYQNPSFNAQE